MPPISSLTVRATALLRPGLVVVVGLAVGALTSIGQTYLSGALHALVNSASAWMVAPFLLGRMMASRRGAIAAGLAVAILQLIGYYITAHLRGFSAGGGIVLFWAACALVGGPLFGAAGHLSQSSTRRGHGLGATALPAIFLAEGAWVYLHELHYTTTAMLWIAIGAMLAAILPTGPGERRWLLVTLMLGLAGEIAVGHLYVQTF